MADAGFWILNSLWERSKSQNWPAKPWPDQTFWQWNGLFSRDFAEKTIHFVHDIKDLTDVDG